MGPFWRTAMITPSAGARPPTWWTGVLKGENPGKIPFERYKKITFGANLKVADELDLVLPEDLLARTTVIVGKDGVLVEKGGEAGGSRGRCARAELRTREGQETGAFPVQ